MPSKIDNYTLLKTLGAGVSAKVKLAVDQNGKQYALKIFDLENKSVTSATVKLLRDEVKSIQNIQHPNIVNIHEYKENAMKISDNGTQKKVHYIALEFVSGGELFDFVALKQFSPAISRFYFSQMLQALHLIHTKGACHRDLKPENILLDSEFNTKIADFGFAAPIEGRDGSGFLNTVLGTQSYMAPEISAQQPYMGQVVDLFALGCILFIMYAGHPPFNQAIPKDPHYKLLCKFRPDMFWKSHEQGKPNGFFSEEFKDLLTNMLAHNPSSRLSMADIIGHPWMQMEPAATHDEVKQEFAIRQKMIDQDKEAEAEEKQRAKQPRERQVHRATGGRIFYEDDIHIPKWLADQTDIQKIQLQMKPFVQASPNKHTLLYSSKDGLQILLHIDEMLQNCEVEKHELHEKKWRYTFNLAGSLMKEQTKEEIAEDDLQVPEQCRVQVDISKVNEEVNCIEFTRIGGNAQIFYQRFEELKPLLAEINDVAPPKLF